MSTPKWAPGTLYNPGALVVPLTAPPVGTDPPTNPSFASGDSGWAKGTGWVITNLDGSFDDAYAGAYPSPAGGSAEITNNLEVAVTPGLVINAQCMVNTTGNSVSQGGATIRVNWYDASHAFISTSEGNIVRGGGNAWYASGVAATAPSGAAFAKIAANAFRNSGPHNILVDTFSWDYAFTTPPTGLIFKAVQTNAGFSANTEPVWPVVLGNTVVDNQVTWEAVLTTRVTYEAHPILKSGSSEPTWPTVIGGSVADNSIIWQAVSGAISDAKCPNSKPVAIAASKVFAGDIDIIGFSATVNPLDWSTINDAGYLPFGLQTYGSQPVAALGLYRSNLVAFNSLGFQMWQVDQDPANMALLDAVPISCTYPRTVQPFANDLVFLNSKGVRNVSIAGASTNLQADGVGQPVDTLVQPKIKAGTYTPIGLFWPFAGQYWLIFGPEAFILTINGTKARSWSRYLFPEAITDWTLDGNDLILRTVNHKIWRMDSDLTQDDVVDPVSVFTVGPLPAEAVRFEGLPYATIPPITNMSPYTVCGWIRFDGDGGGVLRIGFSEADSTGTPTVFFAQNAGANCQIGDPNSSLFTESPDNDRWFFFAIVNTNGGSPTGTGYWCYLEDSSFAANRTAMAGGLGSPSTGAADFASIGSYTDAGGPAANLRGDVCQIRRWTTALTPTELLAEKNSAALVKLANVFSSNPLRGAADVSDESGNGRIVTMIGSPPDIFDGPGN